MDNISIKVHPPWYARGTPVINTRDGPAMALNDKLLFAICRGPSARGKPGECMNALMHECLPDRQAGMNSGVDRVISVFGFSRLWLTLKTTFFNTQNSVYSQWYAVLGGFVDDFVDADRSRDAVRSGETDLSAFAEPDNVEMVEPNNVEIAKIENVEREMNLKNDRICKLNS
jgi:hypothetical protein